jgi:hypothetical protein
MLSAPYSSPFFGGSLSLVIVEFRYVVRQIGRIWPSLTR